MHAPQINTETQWRLNTVAQLTDLQKNYTTFFTDVGNAQRAGTLSASDVQSLNDIGIKLQTTIERANQLWLAYVGAPSGDLRSQLINTLLAAEQILLELTTKRAQTQTPKPVGTH